MSINFRGGRLWTRWTGWTGDSSPPESGTGSKVITASMNQNVLGFLTYDDQEKRLALKGGSQLVTRKVKIKLTNINLELVTEKSRDAYSKN